VAGFTYQDLHSEPRLAELDGVFVEELRRDDPALAEKLNAWRTAPDVFDPVAKSRFLVEAARPLSRFIARLFGIEREWREQAASAGPEAVLFRFRRDFLLRRAARAAAVPEAERALLPRQARAIELDGTLGGAFVIRGNARAGTGAVAEALARARKRVDEDVASARQSGVRMTPTFFVNGRRYDGAWDDVSLSEAMLGSLGHRVHSAAVDFASWAPATGRSKSCS